MDFARPNRKPRSESIVPMINVVFLLLIFFLMTAQIVPPEPFDVSPPASDASDPADGPLTLYLSATGELGFRNLRGDLALQALRQEWVHDSPVLLRADADVPAASLARLMPRLGQIGLTQVQLVTVSQ